MNSPDSICCSAYIRCFVSISAVFMIQNPSHIPAAKVHWTGIVFLQHCCCVYRLAGREAPSLERISVAWYSFIPVPIFGQNASKSWASGQVYLKLLGLTGCLTTLRAVCYTPEC